MRSGAKVCAAGAGRHRHEAHGARMLIDGADTGWRAGRLDRGRGPPVLMFGRMYEDAAVKRAAIDTLLSGPVLRALLRRALAEAAPTDFGVRMRARFERCISRHPNRTNPYLRALVLGERAPRVDASCPPSIELHAAEATAFLEAAAPASYDGFALSNILDGASPALRARLFAAVRDAASERAVVVLRSFREAERRSEFDRTEQDRSILWGRVEVVPVTALTRPAGTGIAGP